MDEPKTDETFQINEIHVWCGRCGREMKLDESSCSSCDRIRRADPPGGGPMGMTTRRYRF